MGGGRRHIAASDDRCVSRGITMDDNTFLGLITLLAFVGGIGYASWQLLLLWLAQKWEDEVPLGTSRDETANVNPVPQTVAHEHYFV
jgi:cytoskeletal protein RodZ